MSTTPSTRSLLAGWVDDAAVFPPGDAPVPQAWSGHLALRASGYAELLGPLLIGASGAGELVDAAEAEPPPAHLSPVAVTVVARAGVSASAAAEAVRALAASPHLTVSGVEVSSAELDALGSLLELGVRVAVEVPREGEALVAALDALAGLLDDGPALVAKLRTQATPDVPAPDARQLAEFMVLAHERGLPFKLTGGLHRAVAPGPPTADGGSAEPHGALNVLVATHHLLEGTSLPALVATLEMGDGEALAAHASGLTEQEARDVRAAFVSFGCCGVTDPLDELTTLGLIPR